MDNSSMESFNPCQTEDSLKQLQQSEDESLRRSLTRKKSNTSELSRIISGIRDDINQPYVDIGASEQLLVRQLTAPGDNHNHGRNCNRIDDEFQGEFHGDAFSGVRKNSDAHGDNIAGHGDRDLEKDFESDITEFDNANIPNPDEGFAWIIAIISMLAIFASWGSNAAYGVFLNYYTLNNTFKGADKFDFALIGGLVVFLAQSLAPLTTLLFKVFGVKIIIIVGLILQTAGYILASFATKLWQLYLTQAVMVGISFSLVYLPATIVLPTWFDKRRSFAFGIAVSGAGLGGIVFALSVDHVINISGNQHWGLRLTALIALISGLPSLFLRTRMKTQQPLSKTLNWEFIKQNIKLIFDPKILNSWPIRILALWFGISLLGYVVMLFSISSYATSVGLSTKQASNLTAFLNAGQTIGRPCIGLISDRFGRTNTASGLALLSAILLYAFWINATTYGSLIPFSIIIGATVGIGSTLCQPIASDLINTPSQLPAAWSILNICVGFFCLPAEVIALSLKTSTGTKQFLHCQIFAGTCFIACFFLTMSLRAVLVKKNLTKRLELTREKLEDKNLPKRYLTTKDLDMDEIQILNDRLIRYEYLLQPGIYHSLIRLFYPLIV